MILIHDGYMIDPKSGREGNYDILIDGDKIVKIAEKIEPRGKVTRINAEGLLVAPRSLRWTVRRRCIISWIRERRQAFM